MKSRVFVIVPVSIAPANVWNTAISTLITHEAGSPNQVLEPRFDQMTGQAGRLSDPIAEGLLPSREKRILHNRIAFVRNLPREELSAALVMPTGAWHGLEDYGYRMTGEQQVNVSAMNMWRSFYLDALRDHQDDYVVEIWVKS